MFEQVLYTQWKWLRFAVLPAVLMGFAIPVLAVQQASVDAVPWQIVESIGEWGLAFPFLAVFAGLTLAAGVWNADEVGKHVYALSLPVPRWHFVLLRFGGGAVLLGAVVFAVWVGNLVAVGSATIPEGLHGYPHAIALRFALTAMLAYSAFFALLAAGKQGRAAIGLMILVPFVVQFLFAITGSDTVFIDQLIGLLARWPGPIEILIDPWLLINV